MRGIRSMIGWMVLGWGMWACAPGEEEGGRRSLSVAGQAVSEPGARFADEPHRVIYQVYIRHFFDADDSGRGDFAGLARKLTYLKDLGVDTLLLMPPFEGDGGMGYIARNYLWTDPSYGTVEQFAALLDAAHGLGMKVIVDSPINHISDTSDWFRVARRKVCQELSRTYHPEDYKDEALALDSAVLLSDPDLLTDQEIQSSALKRYCHYFDFVESPGTTEPFKRWRGLRDPYDPNREQWKDVFTYAWYELPEVDQSGQTTYVRVTPPDPRYPYRTDRYYYLFAGSMPELRFWSWQHNTFNWPVVNHIKLFFKRWIELGVDGFRIDAARHFIEGSDSNLQELEPKNLNLLREWLRYAWSLNPRLTFMGEVFTHLGEIEGYLPTSGNGQQTTCDTMLDFPFMETVRGAVHDNHGESFKNLLKHYQWAQGELRPGWRVVFPTNHDKERLENFFDLPDRPFYWLTEQRVREYEGVVQNWSPVNPDPAKDKEARDRVVAYLQRIRDSWRWHEQMVQTWDGRDKTERIRLAYFLTLTLPFTPLVYYGEEVGTYGKVKRPEVTPPVPLTETPAEKRERSLEFVATERIFPWSDEYDPAQGTLGFSAKYLTGADEDWRVPLNFREQNLERSLADPASLWYYLRELLKAREDFFMTNDTWIQVKDELYGHVLGFTVAKPGRCRTMVVNFHKADTYTVSFGHADGACSGAPTAALWTENAERLPPGKDPNQVTYRLKPYARVMIGQ